MTKDQTLGFVLTVVSLIITILIGVASFTEQYLLRLFPQPMTNLTLMPIAPSEGNAKGCLIWMATLASPADWSIENLDLVIQLPGDITSYGFAQGSEFELPTEGRTHMAAVAVGRNLEGKCALKGTVLTPGPELSAVSSGPGIFKIRGARIPPKTVQFGYFVLSSEKPSFSPARMFAEGTFEFRRLGYSLPGRVTVISGQPSLQP